jgi:hypothetical protein
MRVRKENIYMKVGFGGGIFQTLPLLKKMKEFRSY